MKRTKQLLSLLLAAALCLALTACAAQEDTAVRTPGPTPAATATPAPAPRSAGKSPGVPDKEETVYILADPSGNVRDVTVETVLNYGGDGDTIEDMSLLTDIKNTEGDEEFTLARDGALIWEDHGEKIRYEGKADRELPVTVRLSYWLDGVPADPADLAGKSGHVRIRFDYENHTAQTVTVTHADLSGDEDEDNEDGEPEKPRTEEVVAPIPFLAVSLAMLPDDVFSNVQVTNGRLLSLGEQSAVLGIALPGLSDALSLQKLELTEDAEIPEFVEIEADAEDFSLDFTATILSNGLLDELEDEDLDDIEKLSDGMDKLTEASGKLTDGAQELADGAAEYADYITQYVDGVYQIYSGAYAVSSGLYAVSSQTAPLREAAGAAQSGADALREALAGLDLPGLTDTASALEAVISALDGFQAQLASLPDYAESVAYAARAADSALAGADISGVYGALAGLDLTEEQYRQVLDAIEGNMDGIQSAVDDARYWLGQVPAAVDSPEFSAYTGALADTAARLRGQAADALNHLDELPASPGEAIDRLSELASGVTALCDALDQLYTGSGTLADGIYALYTAGAALEEGADALADGADALADGLREFDEEGISELADLADDDLVELVTQLRALSAADGAYDNFGGIAAGRTGSVRFILETDPIE